MYAEDGFVLLFKYKADIRGFVKKNPKSQQVSNALGQALLFNSMLINDIPDFYVNFLLILKENSTKIFSV